MTHGFCTDSAALVGYLYDDCEPGERDRIAAHLAGCAECTAELAALSATRTQLQAWVPPAFASGAAGRPWALGFQVDSAQLAETLSASPSLIGIDGGRAGSGRETPDPVRAAAPWWTQPLPAWAQAAAAILIFAAGVGFGVDAAGTPVTEPFEAPGRQAAAGSQSELPAAAVHDVAAVNLSDGNASGNAASPELRRLEQQLQAMQTELAVFRANARSAAPAAAGNAVTLAQVNDIVASTKKELLQQLLWRDAAWQTAREDDLRQIEGLVGPLRTQLPADRLPSYGGPTIGLQRVAFPR